ncbi:unnamed protein product [Cuscuta europaea]|uniref:Retrotransposon gag domain-containing protein n=1 Tax=Cuscuta europaea TaxID=41803 RepID=A0A9P0ZEJ5_CUSEU|nr:unnamed protein product [Cuscuta europaea]
MEQIQLAVNQLQSASQPPGSSTSSGSPFVSPMTASLPIREISLGFPHFDGTTPVMEWIFKAEKLFSYHNTPDAARVDIAAMHFDTDVVAWFQMSQKLSIVSTWKELIHALESQFGPSPFDCPMIELFTLQQTGSVSDYYLHFTSLANRSLGLSDEAFLNCFISGLNKDLRRDVVAMCLPTLIRAVALAKLYEDKYSPVSMPIRHVPTPKYSTISSMPVPTLHQPKPQVKAGLPPFLPTPPGPTLRNPNVRRITPAEMQLRRERGLCYFCDEKFSFNPK